VRRALAAVAMLASAVWAFEPLTCCKRFTWSTRLFSTSSNSTTLSALEILKEQAASLRNEIKLIQKDINETAEAKLARDTEKVDGWIQKLLVNQTIDENTEILNSVDQVTNELRDGRFSQEQVNKMFRRLCDIGPPQSRSSCSPVMELLVDACCQLDCIERADNPNKRWSGRVERDLRKKLFALDWGIELDDDLTIVDD